MVNYQEENILFIRDEISACSEAHWNEVLIDISFSLQWPLIEMLTTAGAFRLFTARDAGELIGYAAFATGPMITTDLVVHDQVGLWVKPSRRGPAIAVNLIKIAEYEFKRDKSGIVVQHSMAAKPVDALYVRMGYSKTETLFTKRV